MRAPRCEQLLQPLFYTIDWMRSSFKNNRLDEVIRLQFPGDGGGRGAIAVHA